MNPRPISNLYRSNVATISAPTAPSKTANSITVNGTVEWYKDGATWGVAYKKASASSWSHESCANKSIAVTLAGLSASTKYDIKLYVKFDGEYQYGPAIDVTTSAS